jgi:hypothetical protein
VPYPAFFIGSTNFFASGFVFCDGKRLLSIELRDFALWAFGRDMVALMRKQLSRDSADSPDSTRLQSGRQRAA